MDHKGCTPLTTSSGAHPHTAHILTLHIPRCTYILTLHTPSHCTSSHYTITSHWTHPHTAHPHTTPLVAHPHTAHTLTRNHHVHILTLRTLILYHHVYTPHTPHPHTTPSWCSVRMWSVRCVQCEGVYMYLMVGCVQCEDVCEGVHLRRTPSHILTLHHQVYILTLHLVRYPLHTRTLTCTCHIEHNHVYLVTAQTSLTYFDMYTFRLYTLSILIHPAQS